MEQRFLASKVAADWLTDQLTGQRQLVERSEARLQTFRERTDAITVDEGGQSIVVQHLADLSAAATKAKTERLQKEALYTQLSAMGPSELEALPAILSNDFVQAIRTQLAALERERAELSQIYGDRHPEMIRVSTAIETANGKLRTEVDTVVTSLRNQYEAALANERALTAALDAQKADVLAFNRSGMEYSVLLREAEKRPASLRQPPWTGPRKPAFRAICGAATCGSSIRQSCRDILLLPSQDEIFPLRWLEDSYSPLGSCSSSNISTTGSRTPPSWPRSPTYPSSVWCRKSAN